MKAMYVGIVFTVFAFFFAVTAIACVAYGFVLAVLWGWFVVPALHVAPLTLSEAIGLALLVSFLTYSYNDNSRDPEKTKREQLTHVLSTVICRPFVALIVGYAVHAFI